ncbi:MAG: DUF4911 domain-containing protein [Candidatus Cloacimonetes bacterium]|nr:DUF4911 domain-containing protein [Candidatus Cloacimonadota bacterium]
MNFKVISLENIHENCQRYLIKVKNEELVFLGFFLESFEGWCNYTTIDPKNNLFQVDVTSDYRQRMEEMLDFLLEWEL